MFKIIPQFSRFFRARSRILILSLSFCALSLPFNIYIAQAQTITISQPIPLKINQTVGLVSSGFRVPNRYTADDAIQRLENLGLKVKMGHAVLGHYSYFAGTDKQRAEDINNMFKNSNIHGIFEIRGGWGSARILPYLNYKLISKHPKIFVGFSDITSLLLALYTKAHIESFYGPMPGSYTWPKFTQNILKSIIFSNKNKKIILKNQSNTHIITITPGIAHGVLLGGNLSVLVSMIGTPYFPKAKDWKGKILYLEDTHEDVYQVDRMLTQLDQAGILKELSGIFFGQFTHSTRYIPGSFSLNRMIINHIRKLHIPAFIGAEFGHQDNIWTLPEGIYGTMNANTGQISFK